MKYYIRTTGERTLDKSYSQVEYELLVDKEGKPVKSFIQNLEVISNHNSVLLEDDLILCEDFKQQIEAVIKQYPDKIINFFTSPRDYFTTSITNASFRFNQCTYYPKGTASILANQMKNYKDLFHRWGYDVIMGWSIVDLNMIYVNYRPCLVQHIDKGSLICKLPDRDLNRRSPYFIDYLKELNIDYIDAYKYKDKLIELMNEKFKEM